MLTAIDDRHAEQGDGDPLTGREQHVHLALGGCRRDLVGEALELVGGAAHRGDDHDDVVAGMAGLDDVVGDGLDATGIGHGGAAVLLHDEAHDVRWYWRPPPRPRSIPRHR